MTMKSYDGSCQCGAITFEVDADLDQTVTCNCSRCRRLGAVLTFVPGQSFSLIKAGPMAEYRFNQQVISHRFCPTCGVEPFAYGEKDGERIVAINVNCLHGVNPRGLESQALDGASR